MLAKMFLVAVFVPIYLLMSVVGKEKVWVSLVGSLVVSMLLYMMIPTLTPLDSGITNVCVCLAGGLLFGVGFGAISNARLRKTNIL